MKYLSGCVKMNKKVVSDKLIKGKTGWCGMGKRKDKGRANGVKSRRGLRLNIKLQLIIGFFIPVLFVFLVGKYAYERAASGMLSNYEDSSMNAIRMTANYLDFGFESIESESLQLYNDSNIKNYVLDYFRNDMSQKVQNINECKKLVSTKATANQFISNIHVITEEGMTCLTSASLGPKGDNSGFYNELEEQKRNVLHAVGKSERWSGSHELLDERFKMVQSEAYVCSNYRMMDTQNSCIIIDISKHKIEEILREIDLGEGSTVAFVTGDGKEVALTHQEDGNTEEGTVTFSDKPYYAEAAAAETGEYSQYITADGVECLFMYSKCTVNNSAVCAVVPKELMMREALGIKDAVYFYVLIACIIVAVIGVFILAGISRNMGRIIRRLAKVSQGDLTVDMSIRSRSEFGTLANHIRDTVTNTKALIRKVMGISEKVSHSVERVADATVNMNDSMGNIRCAVAEIGEGITRQASDAEQCLGKMDGLSHIILKAEDNAVSMDRIADKTKEMIRAGSSSMERLITQAEKTGEMTAQVSGNVGKLGESTDEITGFVQKINKIASQTTLLSLNASIEAARAGEMGKGFSVVAEEIGKLAEDSLQASKEIEKLVVMIKSMMDDTMVSSEQAGHEAAVQTETVEETKRVFQEMSRDVEELLSYIGEIRRDMKAMSEARGDTLTSIQGISAVLEQTSASSGQINDTVKEQLDQVTQMTEEAEKLQRRMAELLEAISSFQV